MRVRRFVFRGAVAVSLFVVPALGAETVEGQVVQVQERVRTENGGERQELMIRTREGQMLRLHLGEPGACEGCLQVGDQVRVRTMAQGAEGEPRQVRRMSVERTGTDYTFCNRAGEPIPTRARTLGGQGAGDQDRVRDRDRDRDRVQDPGARSGGAGGRGGGRGGNGGGRG